jgi:hypothetical protein
MNRSLSVDDNRRPVFQLTEIEIVAAAGKLSSSQTFFFEKSPAGDLRAACEQANGVEKKVSTEANH